MEERNSPSPIPESVPEVEDAADQAASAPDFEAAWADDATTNLLWEHDRQLKEHGETISRHEAQINAKVAEKAAAAPKEVPAAAVVESFSQYM